MELEEMQSLWADLSQKIEKQDKIQKELLMEITKQKFRNKLNGIRLPEIIGSIICYGYAIYFMIRFSELELWYNQLFALLTIAIMIVLPTASLASIKAMRSVKIHGDAPAEMLDKFAKSKIRFWKVQKYGMVLGAVLLITIMPPINELQGTSEMMSRPIFWMLYIPGGLLFMVLFSRWVYNRYKRVILASENMLTELE
ncbi:hypothetical protein JYB62_00490 [Algoriphagus lutimaris]|uniref:hypothetical protein n=1 Tax=Algoriphagus lutimaris TaxID=613197 RepID=UPI00196B92A0|nr:hypothetical protein [Algoriphagus lutimaris]MBN3518463.1 hypothetical protein [Algoriphagus lutimaris]